MLKNVEFDEFKNDVQNEELNEFENVWRLHTFKIKKNKTWRTNEKFAIRMNRKKI